jgi:hypothetical protein
MHRISVRSFGLGRDFVSWIDRIRGRREHLARVVPHTSRTPTVRADGWDAKPLVLTVERALNRVLDMTSLGVGVEIVLVAPRS